MTLVSIIEAPATGELEASGPRAVLECSILLYGGSMKTSVINILMLATLASVSFGQEFPKDAAMKQAGNSSPTFTAATQMESGKT